MQKRKAIIKNIITLFLIITFCLPLLVSAQDVTLTNPAKVSTVVDFLIQVRNFLWMLVAPLSAIMMIWAGILFVTSQGNPNKVGQAKSLLTYIVIGVFLALLATGITEIIKKF